MRVGEIDALEPAPFSLTEIGVSIRVFGAAVGSSCCAEAYGRIIA